jgi:hypothetical protein
MDLQIAIRICKILFRITYEKNRYCFIFRGRAGAFRGLQTANDIAVLTNGGTNDYIADGASSLNRYQHYQ